MCLFKIKLLPDLPQLPFSLPLSLKIEKFPKKQNKKRMKFKTNKNQFNNYYYYKKARNKAK